MTDEQSTPRHWITSHPSRGDLVFAIAPMVFSLAVNRGNRCHSDL